MLCESPPADGYNFAVGEVAHIAYLGDLSIYHVRLKSGQMISAQTAECAPLPERVTDLGR
ncbi:putrescine transport ATP-binding protein PotG [Salmonella enterica subsp. enterica]|uniref:Putrescine transport ATP-binding protein PotG n=1 Tax=Salmonella enterica I TaxID=59201 RepID=A0A447U6I0_SALET|nr:putrescine transport ATP-binding protein PotG [Salmonella enterica subsp. enterica]